ncbi:5-formyltetrahydrofolate cyclo-ligase [Oesophagostomum dentatum]|uniref:5-formyltetrahydrofolate cyclo-ligase n=1 Tax=Oesophagostomum dentatum TaxID=61180 RepID=A0A0B1TUP9_OESDE|nr:5-formyltetrahydrofolate cyclo-ligase [Oesophagostomum dentatum]
MTSADKPWRTDPISIRKKELRKEIGERLVTIPIEETARQSEIVLKKLLSSSWFQEAKRLSVYTHAYLEIHTDKIVEESLAQGKEVFVPQFTTGNLIMKMLKVPSLDEYNAMEKYRYGIRQPKMEDNWEPYENSGPLDLMLVPGVGFTKEGHRLGHGMGYYDRFLADHRARFGKLPLLYGLAQIQQMVDSVPLGESDVKLDGVLHADE